MPQSYSAVYVHLVFSSKGRRPYFQDKSFRQALHKYLEGISRQLECSPIRVGGVEDHVHILARLAHTTASAEWVKEMKRVSSMWVKDRGEAFADFQWQSGYAVFSVSQSNLKQVEEYIANQEEHHHTMTFQDELRVLLRKHQIEFDEHYMWD